ncbi:peptidase U32 family protein [Aliiruegeria sabulilitoris]|uniref:peptidase U32 family protein n=1 Tax=Aliiruegeria sabulilitoris TaxID=1510458 RepID=UPI0008319EB6|nr:U32 family peptidase [Aliiruegeria sabulilitoris]NDR55193.1 peptidase U32 [Pseudoruegeria sp. M32A2M]
MKTQTPRRSELLMPAGSLERLRIAVQYGADAVYLGTPDMSLRTKSKFSLEDVKTGIAHAHAHGVRVYLTLNLFTHNKDIAKLADYVQVLREMRPDGVIVADPGVFRYLRKHAPELSLHVSTQANVCSWLTVDYWKEEGAELVVLAREVSFAELAEIREHCPDIRLETFVHGAMCMTYSGRCLLSNYLAERGANQGNCANSCRWMYKLHLRLKDGTSQEIELNEHTSELFEFLLEEGVRPGEFMALEEDMRGSYILNSKDMCLMPKLDQLLEIGVDSLKVEGRNKSAYYVASVTRAYRRAIDAWYRDPEGWSPEPFMAELEGATNRGFTLGFHEGRLKNHAHNYDHTRSTAPWEYAAMVGEVRDDGLVLNVKNRIDAGDVLEFLPPDPKLETVLLRLYAFEIDGEGETMDVVHGSLGHRVFVPWSAFDREDPEAIRKAFPPMTIVRKEAMLPEDDWARIRLDKTAQKIELGENGREKAYRRQVKALQETISDEAVAQRAHSSRTGVERCCGRGCNGCLMFWNDPEYARAREVLAARKHGELLERDGRSAAE